MEYVDGIDIKQYAVSKGGRLPYNEVLDIALPVIYALIIVHSMDILHRDISPDNIYLTRDGNIKLLDFGAARQVYRDHSSDLSILLKQGYTPVEQYHRNGRHGPWSDIYALGATMYFLLTGAPPVESVTRVEYDELLMPSQLGISVPPEFDIILHKMLAVKAEDRFQNVADLKAALQDIYNPNGTSTPGFSKTKLSVGGSVAAPADTGGKNDPSRSKAGGFANKLKNVAKNAADKTGDMIEVSKLNSKISDKKNEIAGCKLQIGEKCWMKYQNGEALEAKVTEICAAIRAETALIEKYQNEIQKIKAAPRSVPVNEATEISDANGALCPSCKQPVSAGTKFCSTCGASVVAQ